MSRVAEAEKRMEAACKRILLLRSLSKNSPSQTRQSAPRAKNGRTASFGSMTCRSKVSKHVCERTAVVVRTFRRVWRVLQQF